jgi:hypothetical protein
VRALGGLVYHLRGFGLMKMVSTASLRPFGGSKCEFMQLDGTTLADLEIMECKVRGGRLRAASRCCASSARRPCC